MVMSMLVLGHGIIWAVWRRVLGGWLNLRRSLIFATMFIMLLPFLSVSVKLWVVVEVASALYWSLGHDYNKWWILLRYPIVGASYAYFEKYVGTRKRLGNFIDGYTACAELLIGFVYGIIIGLLYFY